MPEPAVPDNPYVGPHAIEREDAFFGRDKEVRSLSALLVSERVVLLHSPSGAGKTSLILAGLKPRIAERFNVLPLVRVNLEPPEELRGMPGLNRYVLSTLISLDEALPDDKRTPFPQLAALTLESYLTRRPRPIHDSSSPIPDTFNDLLIFDQFEEILTVSPADGPAKHQFFEQLGEVLQNRRRWALFAIREDYMGGLAPYVRAIPNRLAVTFRLGLLGPEVARLAIQQPAKKKEVDFTDGAAAKLVDDLRHIQIQQPDGSFVTEVGPDIEPVQLQVVCYNLWQSGAADDKVIDENDLQSVGSVDQALASYYANAVGTVAKSAGLDERLLRRWFDEHLITPEGIRTQALMGTTSTEGLANNVLRLLVSTYLVRAETRAGKTWYELSHDRLVKPVRQDNTGWFEKNLTLLQRQSVLWNQQGRGEGLLLRGKELEAAEQDASRGPLTAEEQDFLQACLDLRRLELRDRRQRRIIQVSLGISVLFMLLSVAGLFSTRQQAHLVGEKSTQEIEHIKKEGTANAGFTQLALGSLSRDATATQERFISNATQTSIAQANAVESTNVAATAQANAENLSEQSTAIADYSAQSLADASRLARLKGKFRPSILLAIEAFQIVDDYRTRGNLLDILGTSIRVANQPNMSGSGLGRNALRFSPDGSKLAAGYVDGTVVLWNAQDLSWFGMRGEGSTPIVSGLAYSLDGQTILKSEHSQIVSLWDGLKSGTVPTPIAKKEAHHGDDILCLALSPDGKMFATGGSSDMSIRLWDTASLNEASLIKASVRPIGKPMLGNKDWVQALVFNRDGNLLASAGRDSTVRLWDVATQQQVAELDGHIGPVYTVAFSPDGKLLASGGQDRQVILWDVAKKEPFRDPLVGHLRPVNSVAFSPDGRWLVSGSDDGSLILWDIGSGQMIGQVYTHDLNLINNVIFDPTGKMLASGSKDGLITLWNLDRQAWIDIACRKAGRNFTLAEWKFYFPGKTPRSTCPQWQPPK